MEDICTDYCLIYIDITATIVHNHILWLLSRRLFIDCLFLLIKFEEDRYNMRKLPSPL